LQNRVLLPFNVWKWKQNLFSRSCNEINRKNLENIQNKIQASRIIRLPVFICQVLIIIHFLFFISNVYIYDFTMKSNVAYCLAPLAVEQVEWYCKFLNIWRVLWVSYQIGSLSEVLSQWNNTLKFWKDRWGFDIQRSCH
jgi:hypothetical protein